MPQPRYLLRFTAWRPARIQQTDQPRPYHPDVYRDVNSGVGFRQWEATGQKIAGKFEVHGRGAIAAGPLTAEGVKGVIRELRPQEAEELDAIDAEVAELERRLGTLQTRRREVLQAGFQKGHVVTLKQVREWIETQPWRNTP